MNTNYSLYAQYKKPFFAPPGWLFGVVWSILYPIIIISFGYVFYLFFKKKIPFIVALPFIINLIANLIFTPIQFGLKNYLLAAVDISVVVTSLVWGMVSVYKYFPIITWIQVPYLLWGLFATILQFAVAWLNK